MSQAREPAGDPGAPRIGICVRLGGTRPAAAERTRSRPASAGHGRGLVAGIVQNPPPWPGIFAAASIARYRKVSVRLNAARFVARLIGHWRAPNRPEPAQGPTGPRGRYRPSGRAR
jgi:hypothetical protein